MQRETVNGWTVGGAVMAGGKVGKKPFLRPSAILRKIFVNIEKCSFCALLRTEKCPFCAFPRFWKCQVNLK